MSKQPAAEFFCRCTSMKTCKPCMNLLKCDSITWHHGSLDHRNSFHLCRQYYVYIYIYCTRHHPNYKFLDKPTDTNLYQIVGRSWTDMVWAWPFVYWLSDFLLHNKCPLKSSNLTTADHFFSGLKRLHLFDETLVDGHWNNVTNVLSSVFRMCFYHGDDDDTVYHVPQSSSELLVITLRISEIQGTTSCIVHSGNFLYLANSNWNTLWQGHQETYLTPDPRPWGQTIWKDFKNEYRDTFDIVHYYYNLHLSHNN